MTGIPVNFPDFPLIFETFPENAFQILIFLIIF